MQKDSVRKKHEGVYFVWFLFIETDLMRLSFIEETGSRLSDVEQALEHKCSEGYVLES